MTAIPVPYPAESVDLLKPTASILRRLASPLPNAQANAIADYVIRIRQWFNGLDNGVQYIRQVVNGRASRCPDERVVLAGYSQGAMAIHRALDQLKAAGRPDLLNRVAGVGLVADGDATPHASGTRLGTALDRAEGIATYLGRNSGHDLPPGVGSRSVSLCDKSDLVCDFNVFTLLHYQRGTDVHTTYGQARLEAVGQRLFALVRDSRAWIDAAPSVAYPWNPRACAFTPSFPISTTATAERFAKQASLNLDLGPTAYIGAVTDANGRYRGVLPIGEMPNGRWWLTASTGNREAHRLVSVGASGCLTNRSTDGAGTDSATWGAAGFDPNSPISIAVGDVVLESGVTDDLGSYDGGAISFSCPAGTDFSMSLAGMIGGQPDALTLDAPCVQPKRPGDISVGHGVAVSASTR